MTIITDADVDGGWFLRFEVPTTEDPSATYDVYIDGKTLTTTDVPALVPKKVGCDRPDCPCRCSVCRNDELWETAS